MAACIATYELGVNRLPHDYSEVGTQLAKEAEWIEAVFWERLPRQRLAGRLADREFLQDEGKVLPGDQMRTCPHI